MKHFGYWLPVFFWMSLIFIFSSQSRIQVSRIDTFNFLFFKTLHVVEYAVLYILLYRAVRNTISIHMSLRSRLIAAVLAILYAISDEIHQTYVPTREGHVRDVIIDAVGIALSWIFVTKLSVKVPQKLVRLVRHWHIF